MSMDLTYEILSAYVDGALSEDDQRAVEAALETDAGARETVERLRRVTELTRAAFQDPIAEPVPQRLVDTVLSGKALSDALGRERVRSTAQRRTVGRGGRPNTGRSMSQLRRFALPLAAGLVASIGLGVVLVGTTNIVGPDARRQQVAVGPVRAGSALEMALNNLAMGEQAKLAQDQAVLLVGTFRDRSQRICREFEVLEVAADQDGAVVAAGLACRRQDTAWQIEGAFKLASQSAAPGQDYVPSSASEADALKALIDTLGGTALLSADEEQSLIDQNWRSRE